MPSSGEVIRTGVTHAGKIASHDANLRHAVSSGTGQTAYADMRAAYAATDPKMPGSKMIVH